MILVLWASVLLLETHCKLFRNGIINPSASSVWVGRSYPISSNIHTFVSKDSCDLYGYHWGIPFRPFAFKLASVSAINITNLNDTVLYHHESVFVSCKSFQNDVYRSSNFKFLSIGFFEHPKVNDIYLARNNLGFEYIEISGAPKTRLDIHFLDLTSDGKLISLAPPLKVELDPKDKQKYPVPTPTIDSNGSNVIVEVRLPSTWFSRGRIILRQPLSLLEKSNSHKISQNVYMSSAETQKPDTPAVTSSSIRSESKTSVCHEPVISYNKKLNTTLSYFSDCLFKDSRFSLPETLTEIEMTADGNDELETLVYDPVVHKLGELFSNTRIEKFKYTDDGHHGGFLLPSKLISLSLNLSSETSIEEFSMSVRRLQNLNEAKVNFCLDHWNFFDALSKNLELLTIDCGQIRLTQPSYSLSGMVRLTKLTISTLDKNNLEWIYRLLPSTLAFLTILDLKNVKNSSTKPVKLVHCLRSNIIYFKHISKEDIRMIYNEKLPRFRVVEFKPLRTIKSIK